MGYYTYYELEIIEGDDYSTDHEKQLSEYTDYGNLWDDAIKWYSHEKVRAHVEHAP